MRSLAGKGLAAKNCRDRRDCVTMEALSLSVLLPCFLAFLLSLFRLWEEEREKGRRGGV